VRYSLGANDLGDDVVPVDPGIPALRALASEGFGSVLTRAGVSDDVENVRLLKHQPGRCTFELTCGGRRLALKAYSPARAAAVALCEWLEAEGLASGRAPTVPPIIARSRSLGLLVMAWLEGASGRDLIEDGRATRAGELAAEWLRAESHLTVELGRRYGPDAALQEVTRWARKIGRVDSELGAEASAVVASLRAAPPASTREGVRHGDFSPQHVLDLGDGPGVIDWDSFRRGALELDAARFLAGLSWLAGERSDRAGPAAEAGASLRAGLDGLLDERAVAWYRAGVHIRLAKKLCRERPRPVGWRKRAHALLIEARRATEEP
jgi:Phosphotransferase enzyme family